MYCASSVHVLRLYIVRNPRITIVSFCLTILRLSARTRELRKYIGPGLKLYVKKPSKIVRQNETAPRDRPSPMRKGSSFIRVYTMGDCQHASPVFTQHAWVYTLTRCCVDFEIFNTCFVSGFTQYIQVQQHFRVYTIILRLSLRPREQYVIPTDGATNAPVPLQGSSSSNNPRKSKESTPSKRR